MDRFKYHKDGTLPKNGEIFVFGSNLAGVHGAGAARVAMEKFNAPLGRGLGFVSMRSYAIPTKNEHIESYSLDTIHQFVNEFIMLSGDLINCEFFVTRIGCGLAGYRDDQIAPMFKECNRNCSFAEEWKPYLEG